MPGAPQRKPSQNYYFNNRLLRELRKQRGWNLELAGEAAGIPGFTIGQYEAARMFPPPHRLRALCLGYELDPFEVCELLHFHPVPRSLLRKFRAVCKKEGVTPLETISNFIEVYVNDIQG
ncbi:MAG: XRE family transcriptional regulator [Deltaproteobacteria bacterium]|nr:MAG: XRE family transcriptional regulator [Deltaproteobacteria bacterium]